VGSCAPNAEWRRRDPHGAEVECDGRRFPTGGQGARRIDAPTVRSDSASCGLGAAARSSSTRCGRGAFRDMPTSSNAQPSTSARCPRQNRAFDRMVRDVPAADRRRVPSGASWRRFAATPARSPRRARASNRRRSPPCRAWKPPTPTIASPACR
jgi:hypothetical protein